jgi:hypothetical protein
MGNLTLTPDTPLNMNKVVISVWFRVPTETEAAVIARDGSDAVAEDIAVLDRVVPILMFGSQLSSTGPLQQSCIGVACRPDESPARFLYVHLQPDQGPSCVNTDNEGISDTGPESGIIGNSNNYRWGATGGTFSISLDTWHHLLISWYMGSESSATPRLSDQDFGETMESTSKMYCALDDVNKSGYDLPANWVNWWSGVGDPNDVISGRLFYLSSVFYNDVTNPDDLQTATMDYGSIPYSPLWLPGASSIVTASRGTIAGNSKIELAELQIFCGVVLNTSDATNRRAFIKADGTPERDYSLAEALLGKAPEIRLAVDNFWKAGVNTGSGGAFTKTGTINSYATGPDITP